nr:unnamed protein product [Spirometra erinaceieuropaei]
MTTEAALAFRQKALFQMVIEAVEKDAGEDLPGDVQQGDAANMTVQPLSSMLLPFAQQQFERKDGDLHVRYFYWQ